MEVSSALFFNDEIAPALRRMCLDNRWCIASVGWATSRRLILDLASMRRSAVLFGSERDLFHVNNRNMMFRKIYGRDEKGMHHHKVFIFGDGQQFTSYMAGSFNATETAIRSNNEFMQLTTAQHLVQQMVREQYRLCPELMRFFQPETMTRINWNRVQATTGHEFNKISSGSILRSGVFVPEFEFMAELELVLGFRCRTSMDYWYSTGLLQKEGESPMPKKGNPWANTNDAPF